MDPDPFIWATSDSDQFFAVAVAVTVAEVVARRIWATQTLTSILGLHLSRSKLVIL